MKDFNELNLPANLKYATDHEWITTAAPFRIGISDFAQDQLGDLTYVELPEEGKTFEQGDEFGSLESIKSVSTVYMPVSGKVLAVNTDLADDPGLINRDPYGEGWLIEIEPAEQKDFETLLAVDAYGKQIQENG